MVSDKFADKFLIKSNRLQNWDYSTPACYFVTICTLNHNNFFGKIKNNKMVYSGMGKKCQQCLIQIGKHFNNVKISKWIIMPNHVHLLIEILSKKQFGNQGQYKCKVKSRDVTCNCRDVACYVSTINNNYVSISKEQYFSNISPKPSTLSAIIRSFKSAVSKSINKKKQFFAWQPRFHDHIIQNKKEYYAIKHYIGGNISSWLKDPYYFNKI